MRLSTLNQWSFPLGVSSCFGSPYLPQPHYPGGFPNLPAPDFRKVVEHCPSFLKKHLEIRIHFKFCGNKDKLNRCICQKLELPFDSLLPSWLYNSGLLSVLCLQRANIHCVSFQLCLPHYFWQYAGRVAHSLCNAHGLL